MGPQALLGPAAVHHAKDMRRGGDQRGQSTGEYVGIAAFVALLVVAAIAFVRPSAAEPARDVASTAFCKIGSVVGGGGCDATGSEDGRPGGPGDNPDRDGDGQPDPATPRDRAEAGDYGALGDSYSSGEGADDYLDGTDQDGNRCHRSQNAYSQVVYNGGNFGGGMVFGACSGAVVENYFGNNPGNNEGPQRDRITDDTSLLTVSMGGNDFGFADVLTECVLHGCANAEYERQARERIDREVEQLIQMYLDMRERAPNARILVLGYPQLFPDDGGHGISWSSSITGAERRWLNAMGDYANQSIQNAIAAANAQGADIEYVDVSNALAGHEIGTDDPWMNDLDLDLSWPPVNPASFHPNAQGQQALADAVNAAIDRGR
jgi:lysophospholipase L1-like esterase